MPKDRQGRELPFTTLHFKTRTLDLPAGTAPGTGNGTGGSNPPSSGSGTDTGADPHNGTHNPGANERSPFRDDCAAPTSGSLGLTGGKSANQSKADCAQTTTGVDDDNEIWTPGPEHRHGHWLSGRDFAHSRDHARRTRERLHFLASLSPRARQAVETRWKAQGVLPPGSRMALDLMQAFANDQGIQTPTPDKPGQPASVSGQVLRLNGKPLAGVTLRIGTHQTQTGSDGEFLLDGVVSGSHTLVIDGRSASQGKKQYGRFEYRMDIQAGLNKLDFTIWMPRLDTRHAVRIPAPTNQDVTVTHPGIPGLELHIPAGSVIRDAEGKIVTELTITPVPTDQPPFPLPGFHIPIYYTIQPGGAHIESMDAGSNHGARLIYPNFDQELPGARASFWNYDSAEKGWYIYGTGTVSQNGRQIIPDPDVAIYEFSGAMINSGATPPKIGPKPKPCPVGDPVDCYTGLFLEIATDISLPDIYPVQLTRTCRPNDLNRRAFGVGCNHTFERFIWSANQFQEADLVLPDGGRVHCPS